MALKRPDWIKAKAPGGKNYEDIRSMIGDRDLHTVCQSANCPNLGECWKARTATFMILGNHCTRNCRFCDVAHGTPDPLDFDEPKRVADAVEFLGLKYAVVTSVTRDDLPDGGAEIFAKTIEAVHALPTGCAIEVLIPDLLGDFDSLKVVVDAKPEVLNHNVETVERCYPFVRPQAVYRRSLDLLANVKKIDPHMRTKSGLMVGVGETWDELMGTMRDLRSVDCDVLTVGQYLAPSANHVPIDRYYTPEEFDRIKEEGLKMGFKFVESGALVRSSYHAARQLEDN